MLVKPGNVDFVFKRSFLVSAFPLALSSSTVITRSYGTVCISIPTRTQTYFDGGRLPAENANVGRISGKR